MRRYDLIGGAIPTQDHDLIENTCEVIFWEQRLDLHRHEQELQCPMNTIFIIKKCDIHIVAMLVLIKLLKSVEQVMM